ncbi:MAG: diguanylate cyclase response regulator [Thermoplasmata archaeon]|nr:MAG: diguanylate cyclase response regulator [Deltaproteobacteria bacterium]RLF58653.1 MAG: diguanylate cyclase response regulator [Thermoplasmata archaeon]
MNNDFPILVAEDNPVSRKLLEKTLTKAGYEVVAAKDGREALEIFRQRFFPIVLTDWMMPKMSGPELCKALRAQSQNGYVFMILLTAKDSKDDIVEGLEAGADDYLTKPFNRGELMARLKTGTRILELERSLKKATEEIRLLSTKDQLTGCYNRGFLTEHLPKEVKRARRYGHEFSVVLCDIDHFKGVNDTYGHQAGDEVLKAFAKILMDSIRNGVDWVSRYGGEEFLVVLPETPLQGAVLVAERLRSSVAETTMVTAAGDLHITASFGVTGFFPDTPESSVSPDTIIKIADEQLYQAKDGGRNTVRSAPL